MKELEREVGELRKGNEILRKASAYSAQASMTSLSMTDYRCG